MALATVPLISAVLAFVATSAWAAAPPASACDPVDDLHFICGMEHPEDLAQIPGTRWLIASGFADGSGLKLVDTAAKTMRRWYTGAPDQIRRDAKRYPRCAAPPDAMAFNAQGLSLRPAQGGGFTLYVVNHGGREAIEVFAIDPRQPEPAPVWIGCVPMPDGLVANSVAAFTDGSLVATVLAHPGTAYADFVLGKNTGGVYAWSPGERGFRLLPGTELPGNNGIETGPDDKSFYVVAFGLHAIVAYSRADTTRPLAQVVAPGFMPDNIHWDGQRFIAAGMMYDEPACGGLRKIVDGKADGMLCHRGYMVGALDPTTMTFSVVAYEEPNAAFNGVSTALLIDRTLWLGSYQADRIAYRPLP